MSTDKFFGIQVCTGTDFTFLTVFLIWTRSLNNLVKIIQYRISLQNLLSVCLNIALHCEKSLKSTGTLRVLAYISCCSQLSVD
jgi:hypothetical protein